jgi:hypothetical protein
MAEFELGPVDFDEAAILADARAQAGLDDFGDEGFRAPLGVLLSSLDTEGALHAMGRATQRARIVASLAMRLTTEDTVRRHPEILEEEIASPLVIVGLARTGTTMLHRLISADPGLCSARWWEVRSPAPFPGWDPKAPDPRIADAKAQVRMILETQPVLAAIHPWDAEGPDEEIMLIEHAFLSHVPESSANLPTYRRWLDDQDFRPAYAYGRRLLQLLQWQKRQRGETIGPWVLKTPMHAGYLDELFETFPGTTVVQTHRDPLETIPSVASMYFALWGLATDEPDPHEVGRQCLERYAWALRRCMERRTAIGEEHFIDVAYQDVASDPLAAVRSIYERAGRPFTPEVEAAMKRWTEDNTRDKRPAHAYSAATFGLTDEAIREAFAGYRERFISG